MPDSIHPHARLIVFFGVVIGSVLMKSVIVLAMGYGGMLCLLASVQRFRSHLRIVFIAGIPFLLLLLLVHGFLLSGTAGTSMAGLWHALEIFLRMMILTALFQYTFAIPSALLIPTFATWRIRGNLLITVVGAFSVWQDFVLRADRIITARYARGQVGSRSLVHRLLQVPFVMRPLVTGALFMALERSMCWQQTRLLIELDEIQNRSREQVKYSGGYGLLLSALALCWVVIAITGKLA